MSAKATRQSGGRLSRLRCLLFLPALLAPLGLAVPASAQDVAAAEALFDRGLAEMKAGRYETGCPAIAESQKLDPRPGTLFTLAVCEAQWGRIASAVTRYGDYLALYEKLTKEQKGRQGDRPNEARRQREALRPQIPELTLTLPAGAPAGTIVTRNGVVIAGAVLGISLPVDPGDHTITTQVPGGPVIERMIAIAKGEKKVVTLELKAAPAPISAPEPPKVIDTPQPPKANEASKPNVKPVQRTERQPLKSTGGPSGRRVAAYAAGGAGLAGLVLGSVMGGLTLGKKVVVANHCGDAVQPGDPTACDQTGLDAVSSANATALVSSIGFGVAALGIGTSVVLMQTEPQQSEGVDKPTGRRLGVYAAGGAGLAGLVLGGVMGGLTLGKKEVIADHCGGAARLNDAAACDQTGLDAASSASTTALVSSIGFGVAALGTGTAVALMLTDPQPSKGAEGLSGRRVVTYAAGGAGVAGLVLGGVMGGLTLGKKEVIADHCGGAARSNDATACDQKGLDVTSSASTTALVSTIGFGVAAAGLGAAAALLLTEPAAKPTKGAAGRWTAEGVLNAGPTGAVLGLRGSF
jgi:hypothetical protein